MPWSSFTAMKSSSPTSQPTAISRGTPVMTGVWERQSCEVSVPDCRDRVELGRTGWIESDSSDEPELSSTRPYPHQQDPTFLFVQQVVECETRHCPHRESTQRSPTYGRTRFRNPSERKYHSVVSSLPPLNNAGMAPTLRDKSIGFRNLIPHRAAPTPPQPPCRRKSLYNSADRWKCTPIQWA